MGKMLGGDLWIWIDLWMDLRIRIIGDFDGLGIRMDLHIHTIGLGIRIIGGYR